MYYNGLFNSFFNLQKICWLIYSFNFVDESQKISFAVEIAWVYSVHYVSIFIHGEMMMFFFKLTDAVLRIKLLTYIYFSSIFLYKNT